ncbi:MAG TPA: BamA/TamA family outer membrane protein, partial [Gemmatimonadales bacterium]|nr:BamA/TamA family outer membrane protein [Gemmatimonadales bacterium]
FFGTFGPDTVSVVRRPDGSLELAFQDGRHRTYGPGETDAVALYLEGGADHVTLLGPGNIGPYLDIAWLPGLTVSGERLSGVRTTLFGEGADPAGTRADVIGDTLPTPEVEDLNLLRPPPVPLRGTDAGFTTWFDVNSDVGVLLGGGIILTTYRLGHDPFYRKLRIRAGYATAVGDYAVELHGNFHRWRSPAGLTLDAGISEIAVLHFFGYGNSTPFSQPISYYLARQNQLYLYPAWNYRMTTHSTVAVGPVFKHVRTDTVGSHLINDSRPYGVPEFAQAGLLATATYDTRDAPNFTRTGWRIVAGGAAYPVVFGAGSPFGTMQASAAWYVTLPSASRFTLAARASAKLVMGEVPVHEAAFIGGSTTVRGYEAGRYAGESSAFLNGELRVRVATLPVVVPWQFGVMGLADVGRVFNATDNTNVWHGSVGGGVWFAMPDRSVGLVVTGAWSPQGSAIWFGLGGFAF